LFRSERYVNFMIMVAGFNAFYQQKSGESFSSINLQTGIGYASPEHIGAVAELSLTHLWALHNDYLSSISVEGIMRALRGSENLSEEGNAGTLYLDSELKILLGLGQDSLLQLYTGPAAKKHGEENTSFQWLVGLQFRY
jgi:hypothetical protein